MKIHRLLSQIHKLIGLVVGVQVLLWISGGLVMSSIDIRHVRGEHHVAVNRPVPLPDDVLPSALAGLESGAREVVLRRLLDGTVAEVSFLDGRKALYDAASGAVLSPLNENWARRLAAMDYAGPETISSVALLERDPPIEYRDSLPVWQVTIDDNDKTRLYFSPQTGRLIARRNDTWRLFDFFWMLHIMDYKERTDFNHPLLVASAGMGLALALSGLALLFWRLRRRDLSWIVRRR